MTAFGSIDPSKVKTWPSVAAAVISAIVIVSTMIYFTSDSAKIILFGIIIGGLMLIVMYLFKVHFLGPLAIHAKMKAIVKTLEELAESQKDILKVTKDPVQRAKIQYAIKVIEDRAKNLRAIYKL